MLNTKFGETILLILRQIIIAVNNSELPLYEPDSKVFVLSIPANECAAEVSSVNTPIRPPSDIDSSSKDWPITGTATDGYATSSD